MINTSNYSDAPKINLTLDNSKIIEHKFDDDKKLKISFNDTIISFNIIQTFPQTDYEIILTLEQLYKMNKFFINFESTNVLVEWLLNSIKEKKSNIKFNENKCFIEIFNPISNKSFDLILNRKEKDINSRVNSLESVIIEQNKIIINLQERVKKLETMINDYNDSKKKEENKLIMESDILNKEENDLLLKWLPRKPNKITLLLNSNKDGDMTKTFMNKCFGKCPTLAIIKTTNGYKFGGYTTQQWKEGKIKDNNAFVFSIDKKKKYNINQPENAIGFAKGAYWLFGCTYNAIVIYENCTGINDNYVGNETYNIQEKFELNGGEKNFTVKSFEIFLIEY